MEIFSVASLALAIRHFVPCKCDITALLAALNTSPSLYAMMITCNTTSIKLGERHAVLRNAKAIVRNCTDATLILR